MSGGKRRRYRIPGWIAGRGCSRTCTAGAAVNHVQSVESVCFLCFRGGGGGETGTGWPHKPQQSQRNTQVSAAPGLLRHVHVKREKAVLSQVGRKRKTIQNTRLESWSRMLTDLQGGCSREHPISGIRSERGLWWHCIQVVLGATDSDVCVWLLSDGRQRHCIIAIIHECWQSCAAQQPHSLTATIPAPSQHTLYGIQMQPF